MTTKKQRDRNIELAAAEYLDRGWQPIPVSPRSKRPIPRDWPSLRVTHDRLGQHFSAPNLNIGVLLGEPSAGLIDVDIDAHIALPIAARLLPNTRCVFGRDGKPASHYLFSCTDPGRTRKFSSDTGTLIELRSTGGQTVLPPSIHESGETVRWFSAGEPTPVDRRVLEQAVERIAAASLLAIEWTEGRRHDLALRLGGALAHGGWTREDASVLLEAILDATDDDEGRDRRRALLNGFNRFEEGAEVTGVPKLVEFLGHSRGRQIAEWLRLGLPQSSVENQSTPDRFELTDVGNAKRFALRHGARCRYCTSTGKWFVWTGVIWTEDPQAIQRMAIETAESIISEMGPPASPEWSKACASWHRQSQSSARIEAMIKLARSDEGIGVDVAAFDSDPTLLNVRNGILDLGSGELRPHDPAALMTRIADVDYDPDATDEVWDQFVERTLGGDPDVIAFVQRAAGYCIGGSTAEEVFFLIQGPGGSGKSTFVEAVRSVLGKYGQSASGDTFVQRQSGVVRNDIARMHGARLVITTELPEGKLIDSTLLRSITGGDAIVARFLYREHFEFTPSFKLCLVANDLPYLSSFDSGIWRRLLLIPFPHALPAGSRDPGLKEHLLKDPGARSAILAWLVRGYQEYRREGLRPPQQIRDVTERYRTEQSPLHDFFEEVCEIGEGDEYRVPIEDLHAAYVAHCNHGKSCLKKDSFSKLLNRTGGITLGKAQFGSPGSRRQKRCAFGIKLREGWSRVPF